MDERFQHCWRKIAQDITEARFYDNASYLYSFLYNNYITKIKSYGEVAYFRQTIVLVNDGTSE